MANSSTRYGFRPFKENHKIEWYNAAASQTIAKGDAVILNANGDSNIGLSNSAALLGVAAGPVTTTAGDEQTLFPVWVAEYDSMFVGQCSGTYALTLRGDMVDIEGATGAMMVNENASSTKVLQLIREYTDTGDAIGAYCEVVFKIIKSQYAGTEV